MSTVGTNASTLQDVASREDPNGKIAKIVEILHDTNEILDDMMFVESNLATGHKTTVRSGLPTPTWRLLNYGVQPTKSKTVQVTDSIGMLEAYAEVDKSLADLNGNTAEFRLSEDVAHLEGMSQQMATTVIYGNTASDPEKFLGLAPRYNDLSAENAANIIDGEGTGSDNTSIWLVVWGSNTIHGIYPKGQKGGLHHEDKGQVTLEDSQSPTGKYEGYRTHYKWDVGMVLRDWRYVVRICNIDVSDLTKDASGDSADIIDLMTQALEIPDSLNRGRPVFYCNKTIRSMLRRQIKNSNNVNISMEEVAGKMVVAFDGVPVRRVDAILNTESRIT